MPFMYVVGCMMHVKLALALECRAIINNSHLLIPFLPFFFLLLLYHEIIKRGSFPVSTPFFSFRPSPFMFDIS